MVTPAYLFSVNGKEMSISHAQRLRNAYYLRVKVDFKIRMNLHYGETWIYCGFYYLPWSNFLRFIVDIRTYKPFLEYMSQILEI